MDNVTSIFGNHDSVESQRDWGYGDADFDVESVPLYYATLGEDNFVSYSPVKGKQMLLRTDNGNQLGIHGDKYKYVSHKDMINTARNILERSALDLDGIEETIRVCDSGAMCFVQHNLPNHSIITPDGDTCKLQLLHINSHNGVWSYQGSAGGLQSACLNSQVFLKDTVSIYKSRHTYQLDIDHGARLIGKTLGMLESNNRIWAEWSGIEVSRNQVFKAIATAANSKFSLGKLKEGCSIQDILDMPTCYNNTSIAYMLRVWPTYKNRLGQNFWALYNTLTDWSTHFVRTSETRKNTVDSPTQFIKNTETVRETIKSFPRAMAA